VAQHQTSAPAVVADKGDAGAARLRYGGQPDRPFPNLDAARPCAGTARAIERREQLGPSRSHDAGKADDLAGSHIQRDLARRTPAGPVPARAPGGPIEMQHATAESSAAARVELSEWPTDE